MKSSERGLQIWTVLCGCALNRQTITYKQLADLIGMGAGTLARPLGHVMKYCDKNRNACIDANIRGYPTWNIEGQNYPGEQSLEITESLVRSGKIDIIVIDSVAALTPKDEIEGDMGAYHVGKQARLMSQALRKLTAIVAKSKTTVIFINQIRMQIGVMFGNPETTPGGRALKFYTSVRLDVRRIAQIKKGDEVVGGRIRVKVVKNKVAPPFKMTEFDLMYNEGISKEGEILALGEKYGIIDKKGASYSYEKEKLAVGYDKTRTYLKENPKIAKEILEKIISEMKKD